MLGALDQLTCFWFQNDGGARVTSNNRAEARMNQSQQWLVTALCQWHRHNETHGTICLWGSDSSECTALLKRELGTGGWDVGQKSMGPAQSVFWRAVSRWTLASPWHWHGSLWRCWLLDGLFPLRLHLVIWRNSMYVTGLYLQLFVPFTSLASQSDFQHSKSWGFWWLEECELSKLLGVLNIWVHSTVRFYFCKCAKQIPALKAGATDRILLRLGAELVLKGPFQAWCQVHWNS